MTSRAEIPGCGACDVRQHGHRAQDHHHLFDTSAFINYLRNSETRYLVVLASRPVMLVGLPSVTLLTSALITAPTLPLALSAPTAMLLAVDFQGPQPQDLLFLIGVWVSFIRIFHVPGPTPLATPRPLLAKVFPSSAPMAHARSTTHYSSRMKRSSHPIQASCLHSHLAWARRLRYQASAHMHAWVDGWGHRSPANTPNATLVRRRYHRRHAGGSRDAGGASALKAAEGAGPEGSAGGIAHREGAGGADGERRLR